jgi:rhamnosyltransferase
VNAPSRTDIAAVVVLYNPSADVLGNIDSYSDQVDLVIAVDNSDSPDEALRARLVERGVLHVAMGGNQGIAAALNAGCRRALALGYGWALTMDQDSTATPGLVPALSGVLAGEDSAMIAIVAPAWEPVGGAPIQLFSDVCDLDYAMTSGNLLRLSAFESLGGFREDFFIDHVDNEFCLRARRSGWRVVQRRDAVLSHRPGRMGRVTFPFSFYTLNYSPVRRYYMVRNLFEMSREFGPTFPGWLSDERRHWRKDLLKMLLGEDQRCLKLRMMYRGWSDFRKRRFGSYDDLHPGGDRGTAR